MRKFTYWLEVAALGIMLGLILQGARAWTEPSANPPGGNVGAPINTGGNDQSKSGFLGIYTKNNNPGNPLGPSINPNLIGTAVGGKVLADDFCLKSDPTKCLSTATTGGGGGYCREAWDTDCLNNNMGVGCIDASAPAYCLAGYCKCETGYTRQSTGTSSCSPIQGVFCDPEQLRGGSRAYTCVAYYTCVKN